MIEEPSRNCRVKGRSPRKGSEIKKIPLKNDKQYQDLFNPVLLNFSIYS
jgi:hypothetical protein